VPQPDRAVRDGQLLIWDPVPPRRPPGREHGDPSPAGSVHRYPSSAMAGERPDVHPGSAERRCARPYKWGDSAPRRQRRPAARLAHRPQQRLQVIRPVCRTPLTKNVGVPATSDSSALPRPRPPGPPKSVPQFPQHPLAVQTEFLGVRGAGLSVSTRPGARTVAVHLPERACAPAASAASAASRARGCTSSNGSMPPDVAQVADLGQQLPHESSACPQYGHS